MGQSCPTNWSKVERKIALFLVKLYSLVKMKGEIPKFSTCIVTCVDNRYHLYRKCAVNERWRNPYNMMSARKSWQRFISSRKTSSENRHDKKEKNKLRRVSNEDYTRIYLQIRLMS